MENEKFWLLVSLKLSGEATSEELLELQGMLQQQPGLGLQMKAFEKMWKQKQDIFVTDTETSYNRHLQRLSNHLSSPVLKYESLENSEEDISTGLSKKTNGRRLLIWIGSIAATFLLVFLFFNQNSQNKKIADANNTVSTKSGSKSNIRLPDGTQVWLNGDSKLTYNENFSGEIREVHLTGEAYFDVAKDKEHPFIIHTPSIDLKVLGTAFNVRSYANEKNTETSLIHGSVEITLRNNPDKKIVLKPNEKLIVQNNAVDITDSSKSKTKVEKDQPLLVLDKVHFLAADSSATEILWVKNKLAFDEETLEDIALKIERWYDVKISFTDERLKQGEYSAVFNDESLQEVLEALKLSAGFQYSINKKEIVISHDSK